MIKEVTVHSFIGFTISLNFPIGAFRMERLKKQYEILDHSKFSSLLISEESSKATQEIIFLFQSSLLRYRNIVGCFDVNFCFQYNRLDNL